MHLRRLLSTLLVLLLLSSDALATWSIVVINKRTREVGIASATCVAGSRLRSFTPVIRVGLGGGAAQAFVGPGANRRRIWDGTIARETPQQILDALAMQDAGHQSRQYGIVNFFGPPVTFTGSNAGAGRCGVVGEIGDLVYAIQGNVITGDPVCLDAELALLNTPGDLGQKMMAAMEAARRRGGDGRCSCSQGNPDGCGSPPDDFVKTAHIGYVLLARPGDPDDLDCPQNFGCALPPGPDDYYLALEFTGGAADPDPVFVLQDDYDLWRAAKTGVTDHVLTEVETDLQQLVADGTSSAKVTLRLHDIDGAPVNGNSLSIVVTQASGDPIATAGTPVHVGGNEWELDLTATQVSGRASYDIVVNDGSEAVQLYPPVFLDSAPLTSLHATRWNVSATEGGQVGLILNTTAQAPYHIYGSYSGTSPGTPIGGLMLPLNRDRLFELTELNPGHPTLDGFVGTTDANGHAEAAITFRPAALVPIVGGRVHLAAIAGMQVTDLTGFDVVP
ncbi:MAG: DUF1028 domain-containing protein [bacterium]|nr:DUF1028 domain-containing protein [bacterium]